MRITYCKSILLCALFLIAGNVCGDELLRRLPTTTRLLFRVENGKQWVDQFDKTAIHGVMYSDAFKPLREYLGVASDGMPALQQAGLRTKDIRQLAQGELILARVDSADASSPRATATAFEVDFETARRVFDDMRAEGKRHGATVRSLRKNASDSSFVVELSWPKRSERWIYNYSDGVFSVCDSIWLSSFLLSRHDNSLDQSDAYRKIMSNTQSKEDGVEVQWFVRPWDLANDSETKAQLSAQGFGDISAIGGRLNLLGDRTVHRSFVVAKRPLRRAASGLAFVSGGVPQLPGWMTGVSSCLATRMDFSTAFKGYGYWFDETHGGGEEGLFEMVLEDIRDEPGSPRVDIRKSIVEQLSGPLLSLVVSVDQAVDKTEERVFAVKVQNSQIVGTAIDGLLKGDEDVHRLKLDQYPAWKFGDLSQGGTRQVLGPDLSGLCLCLARGYFIAAPKEDALRSLLSAKQDDSSPSLTQQMQEASQKLGITESIGFGCSESLGPIGRLYERVAGLQARQDAKAAAIPEVLKMFHIEASDEQINEMRSKLPRVVELAKLFGGSVDAAEEVEDGWFVQGIVWNRSP